ncbi:2-amino-4-hydroxy-6-hydroxymethyldihydropteridine diphosphokinase [Xanthobacter dioxanivorans]|uniref:2-amino-4-hydroxy-6-hydroxymethyldihydropteridine pyrophosphokinase n=1 Tax=Xanthobacter dioxanivorans TaxID=2528964 RepID=A0A974PSA1_9HYPH|nr:2-amino-4-hydroxy-6-hydroxymethyldihydropteridine diphosphokinase [Xanthobacter dioxanivorans]QRG08526.1 2-amino-4-hydroxy-6-hydroxymethyldihydropteridine diphosphokinase [Xanthobacter dioxanivorans]
MRPSRGTTAYLCLGSNVGGRAATMGLALGTLARAGLTIRARSSLYETPPWGPIPQGPYLNQVVEVESPVPPRSLLFLALLVERMLGRDRPHEVRFGPRRIDIDILLFGSEKVDAQDLEIPHPRLMERAFALVPLTEIAPEIEVGGVRAKDALAGLDRSGILKVT